jgi:hypothetical protein
MRQSRGSQVPRRFYSIFLGVVFKTDKFVAWHTYLLIGSCSHFVSGQAYGTVKLLSLDAQLGETSSDLQKGKHADPGRGLRIP